MGMLVRYGERLAFAYVVAGERRIALLRGTAVVAELGFDEAARAVTVVGALNGVEVAELLAVGLRVEHGRLVPVALPRAAEHDAAFPRLRWAA